MRIPLHLIAFSMTAALAACSIDAVIFTGRGDEPTEDCGTAGDEDGNDLADCVDPACAGTPACRPACGNGITTAGEACDDGNLVDGDGCDHDCTITACGNGITTAGEACDDGNVIDGDGCEHDCKGTGSGVYMAVADAMIRISSGTFDATTRFGTAPMLETYGSSFGTFARSLIRFDLLAIPPGRPILSAHLYVRMVGQAGNAFAIGAHEIAVPWDERLVTWSTQPPFNPTPEDVIPYQGYTWWRFDVTALVQRWVLGQIPNCGLMLRQMPESFSSGGEFAIFDSREGAQRPYLDIVVGI